MSLNIVDAFRIATETNGQVFTPIREKVARIVASFNADFPQSSVVTLAKQDKGLFVTRAAVLRVIESMQEYGLLEKIEKDGELFFRVKPLSSSGGMY
jgi:Fe2+ or Zn2+ uptake regulation protein